MDRLKGYLYQAHPDGGQPQSFPVGTLRADLPEWVTVDDGAFTDDGTGAPDPAVVEEDAVPSRPPENGPGSSRDHWVEYARACGVDVDPDATRAEIIAAVDAND